MRFASREMLGISQRARYRMLKPGVEMVRGNLRGRNESRGATGLHIKRVGALPVIAEQEVNSGTAIRAENCNISEAQNRRHAALRRLHSYHRASASHDCAT